MFAMTSSTFMGAKVSVAAPAKTQRAVFSVQAGPGPAGTRVITKKGAPKAAPKAKKAAPKAAPKKSTVVVKKAAPKAAPKAKGTLFSRKAAAPKAAPKKVAPKKATVVVKKAAPKKAPARAPVGVAASPVEMFAKDSYARGYKKGSTAKGAQLAVGYKGSSEAGSAPPTRGGKPGRVYKLGKANVDEYSPIFVPETRSSTGDTYAPGTAGLAVWALGLSGLLATSAFLIYSTSAL